MAKPAQCLCLGLAIAAVFYSSEASTHPGLHHDWVEATQKIEDRPFDAQARLRRAKVARMQGNLLLSYFDARWARALAPGSPDPWRALGLAAARLKRPAEAESLFDTYLQMGGRGFDVQVGRAKLLHQRGAYKASLAQIDQALVLKPDVETALLRATWLTEQGRLTQASRGLSELLPKLGHALLLRHRLVSIELQRGAGASALKIVDAALMTAPKNVQWLMRRAEVLRALQRPTEATHSLEQALKTVEFGLTRRPTALRLVQRAEVRLALGDRPGATQDLHSALQKSPKFAKARALAATLKIKEPLQ